jgi:hypothetical protein
MRHARPWLPANAARDETLTRAIETRASTWAGRWFVKPKPVSVKMQEVRDRVVLASDSMCWRHSAGGFVSSLAPMAHAPIASAMLGVETGAHKLTPDDHRVLRELAQLSLRDLTADIAKLIGLTGAVDVTDERQAAASFRYLLQMAAPRSFSRSCSAKSARLKRAPCCWSPRPATLRRFTAAMKR